MFRRMIGTFVRCRASAGQAQAPKHRAHRLSRAVAETLESRWLLSGAPYILSPVASFGVNDTGANPLSTLIADPAGDLFGTTSKGGAYGAGTVFEIPAGSSTLTTLVSFNNADGANPHAGLTLDSAGNLFGTTDQGGPGGDGTVFEVANGSTTITTLASFDGANGAVPNALTLDSAGNLYGTTSNGGDGGNGTAFELVKGSTTLTTLVSFNSNIAAGPVGGITLDSAGNLYGTTSRGGTSNSGIVFEIAKGSTAVTTLASFNNGGNSASPAGVSLDAAGNLYGATAFGGAGGVGTVFTLAKGSAAVTTLASFNGSNGAYPQGPVALDAAGNLYGTTLTGGPGNDGTVFEIAKGSSTVTTLGSFSGTNGAAPEAGVTLDAGNLYGTTFGGGSSAYGTVFEIAKGSANVTTLASFKDTNGANSVAGVTLDAAGNLYGTTLGGDGKIFEIAHGSTTITTLASFDGTNGSTPLAGLALDATGNLYGTTGYGGNGGGGAVFEIAKGSTTVTTLASFDRTNGANPRAGVTLDSAGNLYGTTNAGGASNDGTVFEIAKGSNTITTLASFNGSNGADPQGPVALDADGNLYGATAFGGPSGDGTVFEVAKGSTTATTLASFNGSNGAVPTGGVILDAAGNLYGTTNASGATNDGTVFEIANGSNTVSTLASFNKDTNGEHPYGGVTLDSDGNLFGTTQGNGFGNGPGIFGTVYEIAKGSTAITTLASFNGSNGASPQGPVTLDAAGNLYGTTSQGGASGQGTVFKLSRAIPGDANADGKVDFADLVILARNYGMKNAVWEDGDFNGDGTVGFDDLVTLARNYEKDASIAIAHASDVDSTVSRTKAHRRTDSIQRGAATQRPLGPGPSRNRGFNRGR